MVCYTLSNGYYCWTQKASQAGKNKWSLTEGAIRAWLCCLSCSVMTESQRADGEAFGQLFPLTSYGHGHLIKMTFLKLWECHFHVTFKNIISSEVNVLCMSLNKKLAVASFPIELLNIYLASCFGLIDLRPLFTIFVSAFGLNQILREISQAYFAEQVTYYMCVCVRVRACVCVCGWVCWKTSCGPDS